MFANYHTHTPRCRHASGDENSYVQAAIARGLKIFGFSDHTPQWFPGDYYSRMRMYPQELPEYCATVRQLQKEYAGQLEILLGLEVEYYPAIFPELISRLQDQGIEYILLGQHWIGNEINEPYSGAPTEDETVLRCYCDQAICGMETGLFTYLAHPDLIYYTGENRIYDAHMRRLCRAAKDTNTPLEINFLGISSNRNYPDMRLWALAAEEGCQAVFGIDAHLPQQVTDTAPEAKAIALVEQFGLELLETVPLKKIG